MKRGAIVFLVLAALLVASCGKREALNNPYEDKPVVPLEDLPAPSADPDREPVTHRVYIKSFGYGPQEIAIKAGDSVKWINMESYHHQLDFGTFKSQVLLKNQQWEYQFDTPGRFDYSDPKYSQMHGAVIVET